MRQSFKEWDEAYQGNAGSHKNKYPSELVVSWVLRNFRSGEVCLDIGCGWGNNLRFLLAEGFDAYGIDFAGSAVEGIKGEFGERVRCESIKATSWPDNCFDFAIDRSSIQHNKLSDLPAIYKEVHRILKPGGRIFSIMLKQGDNGFLLARPTLKQLKGALSCFSKVEIDYLTRTENNNTTKSVAYLMDATK